jgi:hypothetical protein
MATRVRLLGTSAPGSASEQLWLTLLAAIGLVLAAGLTWSLVHPSAHRNIAGAATASAGGGATAAKGTSRPGASASTTTTTQAGSPGVFVVVRPRPNGDLDVVEEVRTKSAVDHLQLTLPTAGGSAALVGVHPTVSQLSVVADGGQVPVPHGGKLKADGRLLFTAPKRTITLTYRLSGAAAHTGPGPASRVLATLPPLAADRSSAMPVVVRVVGPGVLNLICPDLAAAKQLCGRRDGDQWTTPSIPAKSGSVIAQLNLSKS